MSRRKKGYKGTRWFKRFQIAISGSQTTRTNRRRIHKYRRSINYWQCHDELIYSKVILRDVEKIWLETNTPNAKIVFQKVVDPENYPRYRAGVWDGNAFFVIFNDSKEASKFKVTMWGFRG